MFISWGGFWANKILADNLDLGLSNLSEELKADPELDHIYQQSHHWFCLQHVSRKAGSDFVLEGSNASAEEADEGTEEAMESGVDLILNHRLVETGFGKKADYMNYLKDYMKRVVAYLESNDKKDQVEGFKKNINGVMKGLLGKFNDLQFFTGKHDACNISVLSA